MRLSLLGLMFLMLGLALPLSSTGCAHNESVNQFSVPKGRAYLYRQESTLKEVSQKSRSNRNFENFNKSFIYEELGAPAKMARNKWTYFPHKEDEGTEWGNQKIEIIYDGVLAYEVRTLAMNDKDWTERNQAMK